MLSYRDNFNITIVNSSSSALFKFIFGKIILEYLYLHANVLCFNHIYICSLTLVPSFVMHRQVSCAFSRQDLSCCKTPKASLHLSSDCLIFSYCFDVFIFCNYVLAGVGTYKSPDISRLLF